MSLLKCSTPAMHSRPMHVMTASTTDMTMGVLLRRIQCRHAERVVVAAMDSSTGGAVSSDRLSPALRGCIGHSGSRRGLFATRRLVLRRKLFPLSPGERCDRCHAQASQL